MFLWDTITLQYFYFTIKIVNFTTGLILSGSSTAQLTACPQVVAVEQFPEQYGTSEQSVFHAALGAQGSSPNIHDKANFTHLFADSMKTTP